MVSAFPLLLESYFSSCSRPVCLSYTGSICFFAGDRAQAFHDEQTSATAPIWRQVARGSRDARVKYSSQTRFRQFRGPALGGRSNAGLPSVGSRGPIGEPHAERKAARQLS